MAAVVAVPEHVYMQPPTRAAWEAYKSADKCACESSVFAYGLQMVLLAQAHESLKAIMTYSTDPVHWIKVRAALKGLKALDIQVRWHFGPHFTQYMVWKFKGEKDKAAWRRYEGD